MRRQVTAPLSSPWAYLLRISAEALAHCLLDDGKVLLKVGLYTQLGFML